MEEQIEILIHPLKLQDKNLVVQYKGQASRHLKVLSNISGNTLSTYISDLLPSYQSSNYTVNIFVKAADNSVQIPLSFTIGELMIITHQSPPGEFFYSFESIFNNY